MFAAHGGSTSVVPARKKTGAELASIIIEVASAHESWLRHECSSALFTAGLFVQGFKGAPALDGSRRIFLQVYATEERLLLEAERTKMRLNLDKNKLKEADIAENRRLVDEEGVSFSVVGGDSEHVDLSIPEPPYTSYLKYVLCCCLRQAAPSPTAPYENIYGPYTGEERVSRLFYQHVSTQSILSPTEALKLLRSIIEAPAVPAMQGAGLNLDSLTVREKKILRWFPVHDPEYQKLLEGEWATPLQLPFHQPITRIKNYYGEKMGYYFAFLGFYTRWLIFPALVGVAVFVHQAITKTAAVDYLPAYGIFVALWCTFFMEFWKREQNTYTMKWGMSKFKLEEQPRPGFTSHETLVRSNVNGRPSYEEDPTEYRIRTTSSGVLVSSILGIVIVVVGCIFWIRVLLVKESARGKLPPGWPDYITSILNALQIQVMNYLYDILAYRLTDCENHKTQTAYDASLVIKLAVFYTINSYFGLVYIAAIKNNITIAGVPQQCNTNSNGVPDCMAELQSQLAILLITRFVMGFFFDIIYPWLVHRATNLWTRFKYRNQPEEIVKLAAFEAAKSPLEREADLAKYDYFSDYLEIAIQWGYITLFVVAFPLAPLIAFISAYVEIRIDTYRVLRATARTMPEGAQDIGAWRLFFEALGYISTVTNLTIVVFTNQGVLFGANWNGYQRLVFFIVAEHILLLLKYAISTYIPDTTFRTQLQLARQEYLVDKHVFGVKDVEQGTLKRVKSGNSTARQGSIMAMDEEERAAIAAARESGMADGGNWRTFAMGGGPASHCQLPMSDSYASMQGSLPSSALEAGTSRPGPAALAQHDAGGAAAMPVRVAVPVSDAPTGAVSVNPAAIVPSYAGVYSTSGAAGTAV